MIRLLPQSVVAVGTVYRSATRPEVAGVVPAARSELEKLRGSWVLVYWLFDGKEQDHRAHGKIVMSFDAERFTIHIGGAISEEGVIEGLDPGRVPKAFYYDPRMLEGRPVQLRYPAVYLLEGDVFVACIGYAGSRPGTFSAEAGSRNELVFYKRISSESDTSAAPPPSTTTPG